MFKGCLAPQGLHLRCECVFYIILVGQVLGVYCYKYTKCRNLYIQFQQNKLRHDKML